MALISTEELAALIPTGNLTILDCTFTIENPKGTHFQSRIPNSKFFDFSVIKNPENTTVSVGWPTLDQFTHYMRQLGLPNDGKPVILYSQNGIAGVHRAWVTLIYFGYSDVKILDGGLVKWTAEGRETISGEYEMMNNTEDGNYNFIESPQMRILYEEVKEIVEEANQGNEGTVIWDPRGPEMVEAGSVPHSKICPFPEFFNEDKTVKSVEEVRKIIEGSLDLSKPVITNCMKGFGAAIGYFMLKYIGKEDARLYAESFEEWKARNE